MALVSNIVTYELSRMNAAIIYIVKKKLYCKNKPPCPNPNPPNTQLFGLISSVNSLFLTAEAKMVSFVCCGKNMKPEGSNSHLYTLS